MDFTPLSFSVLGLQGKECRAAVKCLGAKLADKWKRPYSMTVGFVNSRLAVALVRAASHCLRGTRDPTSRPTQPTWDGGAAIAQYGG